MELPLSLFDKIIGRPRPLWLTLSIAFILYAIALVFGSSQYGFREFFLNDHWRGFIVSPSIIIYILVVAPLLSKIGGQVIKSIRPLVDIEEEQFCNIVYKAAYIEPWKELVAILLGLALGVIIVVANIGFSITWTAFYITLSNALIYGLLAWVIYVSLTDIKLTATLLRLPLLVDPFDIAPFEPIGRQSLLLAIVFIGGITLSLVFVGFESIMFHRFDFWLIYLPMFMVPVVIFFMNMYPTHRVILAAKERELKEINNQSVILSRKLLELIQREVDTGNFPAEINALSAYEQRLQSTRTWPFNFAMLRTLFFSILVPGFTALLRVILGL